MNLRLPLNLDGLLRQRTVEDERIEYKVGNLDPIIPIIKETLEGGLVRPYDESASRKFMRYVPFWA
jgi:hypothetical protein